MPCTYSLSQAQPTRPGVSYDALLRCLSGSVADGISFALIEYLEAHQPAGKY